MKRHEQVDISKINNNDHIYDGNLKMANGFEEMELSRTRSLHDDRRTLEVIKEVGLGLEKVGLEG